MQFHSYNLKLVVINELIGLGLLKEQLAPIYEKQRNGHYEKYFEELESGTGTAFDDEWDDDFDDFFDDDDAAYYGSHPEMEEEIDAIVLTPEMLARIEKIDLDYGETQGMLAPHWHGEDELFYVRSLDDLALLPNLRHVKLSFVLDDELKDYSPLLKVPKLETVTTVPTLEPSYFFDNDKKTQKALLESGVTIRKGK